MNAPLLVTVLLALSSLAYWLGRRRAFSVAQGAIRNLHSLPSYYGLYTAIWCGIPALLLVAFWLAFESSIITELVIAGLPEELRALGSDRLNLVVNDIKNLVSGNITSRQADAAMLAAAEHYRNLQTVSHAAMGVAGLALAIVGGALTLTRIRAHQRARNAVESIIKGFLIVCSSIAILTSSARSPAETRECSVLRFGARGSPDPALGIVAEESLGRRLSLALVER